MLEVLRCSACGASVKEIQDFDKISQIKCAYCDSVNILPKHKKNKIKLYNIATQLRQEREFDQAIKKYEELLAEDGEDYSAHWGLLLSKYGVEYVEDVNSEERVPNFHRVQEESILTDVNYIAAVEYADEETKRMYQKAAAVLEEDRADVLAAAKKQAPFDVFICYKETDQFGNRTEDSVLAHDIYNELIKKNYRVFFARKTIPLGTKYEPIIYAALHSAQIMIVVGTKSEYLDSVWVRNEWSRYQKLTKGTEKSIFLAYQEMNPKDFPGALKPWEALDMTKLGAMQDLVDAVDAQLKRREATGKQLSGGEVLINHGADKCERLLKNGITFLQLNNMEAARDVYKTLTQEYPEEYRGWWGRILCETENLQVCFKEKEEGAILDKQIDAWFRYVKKLAPADEFAELEEKYLKYAEWVNEVQTERWVKNGTTAVATMQQEMEKARNEIGRITGESQRNDRFFEEEMKVNNKEVRDWCGLLNKYKRIRIRKMIGWCIFGIGVLLFIMGMVSDAGMMFLGLLFGLAVGLPLAVFYNGSQLKRDIEEATVQIEVWKEKIDNAVQRNALEKANYNQSVSVLQKKIGDLYANIKRTQDELALGEEQLRKNRWEKMYREIKGLEN